MIKSKTMGLFAIAAIGLVLACGMGNQTAEADKLMNEANALIADRNTTDTKTIPLMKDFVAVFATKSDRDFENYKTRNKARFDELVSLLTNLEKSTADAAAKMDQASKLKVDDKAKEYYSLKFQELFKSAEQDRAVSAMIRSALAAKEIDEANRLLKDWDKKDDDFTKETEALKSKVDQFTKDNPGVFSSN